MPIRKIKAIFEGCGHEDVLTLGEAFRIEKDRRTPIRCTECGVDKEVRLLKPMKYPPMCIYCFHGDCNRCVFIDRKWGDPGKGATCGCHEQGHGEDPYLKLVWALGTLDREPHLIQEKLAIISAATEEDKAKALAEIEART